MLNKISYAALVVLILLAVSYYGVSQTSVHLLGTGGFISPCVVTGTSITGCVAAGTVVGGVTTLVSGSLSTTALITANQLTGTSQSSGPCTFSHLAGSATEPAYLYVSNGNPALADGIHIKAATNTFTASGSGCTADAASAGSNPAGSTLLYTWPITSGTFGATFTTDWRAILPATSIVAGVGLVLTGGNGLAINTATVQQFVAPKTISASSYVVLDSDRNSLLIFTNVGAVAVTLPQAGSGGSFVSGWKVDMQCLGCGGVTLTPTTSTINGTTSLSIPANVWAQIRSDGTNYNGATTQGAVGPTGATGPTAINGSLVAGNVVSGFGPTTIQDSTYAVPTGGFVGINQTNTFGASSYNNEAASTTPHRLPVIAGCNPGTTSPGQICYDSTQQSYVFNDATIGQSYPVRALVPAVSPATPTSSWQCSTDAGTYNGGTSAQAVAGSPCYLTGITIPASTLIASKGLECSVGIGYTSGTTPPTTTYVLGLDSTTIWFDNGQSSTTASLTNQGLYGVWSLFLNSSGSLFTEGNGPKAPASISTQWRNAKAQPVTITAGSSHVLQFGVQYSAITNAGNNTWLRHMACKEVY